MDVESVCSGQAIGPMTVDMNRLPAPLRLESPDQQQSATVARKGLSPQTLRRVFVFIEANLAAPITLDELAATAFISRYHFARRFRASTGRSPMQYVTAIRVERAKSLLTRGEYSICYVAARLGFCDQSHFTRTFRRLTGMLPTEYIRRTKNRPSTSGALSETEGRA